MSAAREFWNNLDPRERLFITAGSVALVVILSYTYLARPMIHDLDRLRKLMPETRKSAVWMTQAVDEVKRLEKILGDSANRGFVDTDIKAFLTTISTQFKLDGMKVIPKANTRVKISFESADFTNLLKWMTKLRAGYGIEIDRLEIAPLPAEGTVSASASLVIPQ